MREKGAEAYSNQYSLVGSTHYSWQTAFLFAAAPKQRSQSVSLPISRAQPVALSDLGVHLAVLPDLGPQTMDHTELGALETI